MDDNKDSMTPSRYAAVDVHPNNSNLSSQNTSIHYTLTEKEDNNNNNNNNSSSSNNNNDNDNDNDNDDEDRVGVSLQSLFEDVAEEVVEKAVFDCMFLSLCCRVCWRSFPFGGTVGLFASVVGCIFQLQGINEAWQVVAKYTNDMNVKVYKKYF